MKFQHIWEIIIYCLQGDLMSGAQSEGMLACFPWPMYRIRMLRNECTTAGQFHHTCLHVGATIVNCRWRGRTPRLGKVATADHRLVTKYLRFVWHDEPNASWVVSCFRTWQRLSLNLDMSRPFTRLPASAHSDYSIHLEIWIVFIASIIDVSFQVTLNIIINYYPFQNTHNPLS